jgi:hypothetical protein
MILIENYLSFFVLFIVNLKQKNLNLLQYQSLDIVDLAVSPHFILLLSSLTSVQQNCSPQKEIIK